MSEERIAIITDSISDPPTEYLERFPIFVAPLFINYKEESFLDRVTITPEEVYARFEEEIPSTATPTPESINSLFQKAVDEGYTHVICINASSNISASATIAATIAQNFTDQLTIECIDTLNIAIGSGMSIVLACDMIEEGRPFDEIVAKVREVAPRTHTYFIVNDLKYLYQGGRITKAVYNLGKLLNMFPIITCDENGYYATAAKARGKAKAVEKAIQICQKESAGAKRFRYVVANGNAIEEAAEVWARREQDIPGAEKYLETGQISPALTVHTGPGLVGLVMQVID